MADGIGAPATCPSTPSDSAPSAPAPADSDTRPADAFQGNTWAERNPEKTVQPVRPRPKPTDAQRNAQKVTADRNRAARVLLAADITNLVATRKQEIEELATQHNVTFQHIQKLVDNTSHYKKSRAPNLSNALVHMKAKELNEDLPEGSRKTLKEIKEAADNDPAYQSMSREAKNEALAELQVHRNLKATGARASNTSAAKDVASTMAIQGREMQALAERTGVHVITFVTRGHVDDLVMPAWHATIDSVNFLPDALKLSAWDVVRMFEQWACARSSNSLQRETVLTIRAEIVKNVQSGLTWATSSRAKKLVKMNYVNFDTNIVQVYKCKIIGWVGKFVNPSEIGSIEQLRTLRDAWASGSARWVRLSPAQVKAHIAEIEEQIERGDVTVKVRKQRSDAGQSRGGKRKASNKENGQHANKKAKRARVPLLPKSNAIIATDDEGESKGEDAPEMEFQEGSGGGL